MALDFALFRAVMTLPEPLVGESNPGAGLQVAFEGVGFGLFGERDVGLQGPRAVSGGLGDAAGVVSGYAFAQIFCVARVPTGRV